MINYEPFLSHIAAALQGKEKSTASLTEAEIKAAVSLAYKEAVSKVAADTGGYTIEVPVHLYEGLKSWDLEIPEGFRMTKVVRVNEVNAAYPPAAYIDRETLHLPCCANKTINNAFILELAVIPDAISNVCEFESRFINEYFQSILAYMRYTLSMQVARQWHSLGIADRLLSEYKRGVKKHRNEAIRGTIKVRQERLTENGRSKTTTVKNQNDSGDSCPSC